MIMIIINIVIANIIIIIIIIIVMKIAFNVYINSNFKPFKKSNKHCTRMRHSSIFMHLSCNLTRRTRYIIKKPPMSQVTVFFSKPVAKERLNSALWLLQGPAKQGPHYPLGCSENVV